MLVEKKYLTPEFILNICIGLIRFDAMSSKNTSLASAANLINYFFITKANIYSVLSKVYDTDNLVFLKILSYLISLKISSPNLSIGDIRQDIINQLEHKLDNNSFNKAHKFLQYLVDNIENNRFNNATINIEFEKCLKFILLNDSINNLTNLYNDFYSSENSHIDYDKVLSQVFLNYEQGLSNDEFIIENDDADIDSALKDSAQIQNEVRTVSVLEEIRFLEKKRIAILIGASGAGKSMFLCHATAEYLTNIKSTDKKHIIFYFTFENSKAETWLRIMANICNITIDQIKEDINDDVKRKKIIDLYKKKKDPNTIIVISELPPKRHTMNSVEALISKTLLRYKDAEVYAVMLDYVDKMLPVSGNKNLRTDESLGLIVDDFKALVKQFDTCGITVSQFNREGAKKARSNDEMATATDIGGGWSKYENADVVITMQVKNTFEELGYNIVVLINEKHRYFRDGTVIDCIYKPQYAKFLVGSANTGGMMAGKFEKRDTTNDEIHDQISIF